MANLLDTSKTLTPAFALIAAFMTLGFIPAHESSVNSNSVNVQVVHYESSASGGVLHL
jgi:hypothetical protein